MFDKLKKKAESAAEKAKEAAKEGSKVLKDVVEDGSEVLKEVTEESSRALKEASTNNLVKVKKVAFDSSETLNKNIEKFSDNYIDSKLDEIESYCSWCFEKHGVILKEKNSFSRNIYICKGCGKEVVKCRVCDNKAKYSEKAESLENSEEKDNKVTMWSNNFCAVHEGQIAKFESLNWSLNTIGEYRDIVERTERNYKKIGTTIGFTIGGAAVIAPLAFMAAPAIGGAIGTSMGVSGAAATNAGLATLGGGALATGGAGMAGGVAVVTAAGAALGGKSGAVISNSYFGDIDGFDIIKLRPGVEPAVICIDGFLNEGSRKAPQMWLNGLADKYKENAIYYIKWESQRLEDIANSLLLSFGQSTVKKGATTAALSASKAAATKLAPLGSAFQVLGLASNPWSVAGVKAYQAGALLADIIARTDKEYILIGHSLGSRVIYSCLSALKTKDKTFIKDVHLLGGAVNNTCSNDDKSATNVDWKNIENAVNGSIFNYYSMNDTVLKILYKVGESVKFENGTPIGRNKIDNEHIEDIDVTDVIKGHTEYKNNLSKILKA